MQSDGGPRYYLDLKFRSRTREYFLELKYKTRRLSTSIAGEEFVLRQQGAQDLGRYDFLKDIIGAIEGKPQDTGTANTPPPQGSAKAGAPAAPKANGAAGKNEPKKPLAP